MLVVALAAALSGGELPSPVRLAAAPRALVAGRVASAVVVLAALPGFVSAVADILAPA